MSHKSRNLAGRRRVQSGFGNDHVEYVDWNAALKELKQDSDKQDSRKTIADKQGES